MDKEKIRALAGELKEVAESAITILRIYDIPRDFIASINISPDGYMNISIQDEPWNVIRCGGEEKARLRTEEEV